MELTKKQIQEAKALANIFKRAIALKQEVRKASAEGNTEFLKQHCEQLKFVQALPKR